MFISLMVAFTIVFRSLISNPTAASNVAENPREKAS